jgi:parvulin-like peptidyl-prolyl isomerase
MRMTAAAAAPAIPLVLACAAAAALTACTSNPAAREERMSGETIMPGRGRLPTEPYSPVDQPGELPYDEARGQREPITGEARATAEPTSAMVRAVDRAVPPLAQPLDQNGPRKTTGAAAATQAATTNPAASVDGSFQTVGGVVAIVNGVAIYADKVIADMERDLAAKAAMYDQATFRTYAEQQVPKQVGAAIRREMLVAAANRLLDERDKEMAKFAAEMWRQREITKAGGSIEMARVRAAANKLNFDQLVEETHRDELGKRLIIKRVVPQIQITAAEMRRYYEDNLEKVYTERAAAQFEMIQIDPAKVGGDALAKQKIDDLHARAVAGEDFRELAKFTTGLKLRDTEGQLKWFERGAFAVPAVEEAVWKLQPGQITPMIQDGGKYYIARLEQRREQRVRAFEEAAVQDQIKDTLWTQQFNPRYEAMMEGLQRDAIVRTDPTMMQTAIDIAMQRYPIWKAQQQQQ